MSTNVSGVSSHFPDAENGFTTTTSGSVASGATTVGLASVGGYTNGQPAVFVIDPTDASKKQTFTGIIDTSGVQVTSVVWTAGTNQTHALGATVVDYATATHIAMISKGIQVEHSQAGTHTAITSTSITNTGALTQTGTTTLNGSWDGWIGANESWAYASATTITVPTDATTKYSVGDFIKMTQSATVKYFQITSLTSTVLTVFGLGGVTVANSAITLPAYSHGERPIGVTGAWQSWTPTWTILTIGNATQACKYTRIGNTITCKIQVTLGSTSSMALGVPTLTLPVTAAAMTAYSIIGDARYQTSNNSGGIVRMASTTTADLVAYATAGAYVFEDQLSSTAPGTWTTGSLISATFTYEAA